MALSPGILRSDVDTPLMPEEVQREIVKNSPQMSAVLRLMRRLPNMSRAQRRMPVLSLFPTAFFVNGDTGQKKTTKMQWKNKFINAEELAVIVPIPDTVLDDAGYDIWGEVRPEIEAAIGLAIDRAVLWGENAPATWPMHLIKAAFKSNNVVVLGTGVDLADDIGGENGVMSVIEADGYDVSGFVAGIGMKGKLRGLRDSQGRPLYLPSIREGGTRTLYGESIEFLRNGNWDETKATAPEAPGEEGGANMLAGDFSQAVFAMRQDVTFKILTEAVIQDDDDSILYNLAQQDMVALRVVIRLGWQVPNPMNREKTDEFDWDTPSDPAGDYRYPFGALVPPL